MTLALTFGSVPATAQSAADKATAREAATQGIGLYRAGKFADALDRLKRAQALYDAPVHVLYIARAEDKLGQLVEAAENYRLLDRYALPSDAPAAWTAAVEDGRKELGTLEPRIPKVRIVTEPATVSGATLTIDGVPVSAAVVGIERPTNPGKHHIAISAPGYDSAEADAEVAEGQTKDIELRLDANGGTTAPVAATTTGAAASTAPAEEHESRSLVGFMGGLRLGVGIPTGTLLHVNDRDIATSDPFNAGGALELHLGVRIARYFTPLLFIEGETLAPGNSLAGISSSDLDISNTRAGSAGVGVMIGSAPGKLGGFGEFDFVFASSFNLTFTPKLAGAKSCDLATKGGAFRFGGGATIPVLSWLHLTPLVMATIGNFTSLTAGSGCDAYGIASQDITSDNRRTHGMLLLGIGGDVILGRDK
ncbi:MAG TPA: PEGA domain-containing protein [Polyangiaceae bacterium]|nr:PEGA domain-containing protein [Polyangiaceae bacterium]